MTAPQLILRRGKDVSLRRFHPWVFSGALWRLPEGLADGDIVRVLSAEGQCLGTGHYQEKASIAVRILSFNEEDIDATFWHRMIGRAVQYRQRLGLPGPKTTAYRLIHGEGDNLPGLIVDVYGAAAVIQVHSTGMFRAAEQIAEAIMAHLSPTVSTIYLRCKDTMPASRDFPAEDCFLRGDTETADILENGVAFTVDIAKGQKTGFFLDQRENRRLLANYSPNRTLLNCFCYTGGFSIYALCAGAKEVTSVDISSKAMEQLQLNLDTNTYDGIHHSYCDNVLTYLSQPDLPLFDIVLVDPPAFAKSLQKRHNAVQAYKRLNEMAIRKVENGGFLFTFSCSQVVTQQLFYDTIIAAGISSGRKIKVVHQVSQGPDHPVQLFHPEGHYLKGLVLYIED